MFNTRPGSNTLYLSYSQNLLVSHVVCVGNLPFKHDCCYFHSGMRMGRKSLAWFDDELIKSTQASEPYIVRVVVIRERE